MTKSPLISIIIPVYNAQDYIMRALRSVENQTYKNFEAIIVNDGSTNNKCCDLIKSVVYKDMRFKLINIENSGVSRARFEGIMKAKGVFTCFLDSDDFVAKDWLSVMLSDMLKSKADIVCVNYCEYYENTKTTYKRNYDSEQLLIEQPELIVQWCMDNRLKGFLWNKMFLTETLRNYYEVVNFNYLEDSFIVLKILEDASSLYFDNRAEYFYCIHEGSAVNSKFKLNDLLAIKRINRELDSILVTLSSSFENIIKTRKIKLIMQVFEKMEFNDFCKNNDQIELFSNMVKKSNDLNILFNPIDILIIKGIRGPKSAYCLLSLRKKFIFLQRSLRQIKSFTNKQLTI